MGNDQSKKSNGGSARALGLIATGSILTLILTIITHLWLIPSQEKRMHRYEMAEQKVSKFYQPILIATANGNLTITSDVVFHKVRRIMEEYSHLADKEVTDKFIAFYKLCEFADLKDMIMQLTEYMALSQRKRALPEVVLAEIIKNKELPLKWHVGNLENALEAEKAFQTVLKEYYQKAYEDFINY